MEIFLFLRLLFDGVQNNAFLYAWLLHIFIVHAKMVWFLASDADNWYKVCTCVISVVANILLNSAHNTDSMINEDELSCHLPT